MKLVFLIGLLSHVAGLSAIADGGNDADARMLAGDWLRTRTVKDGRVKKRPGVLMLGKDNTGSIELSKGVLFHFTYRIDSARMPKRIDLKVTELTTRDGARKKLKKTMTLNLIYSLKGNTLKLGYPFLQNGKPPKKFDEKGTSTEVYERAKKK